MHLKALIGLETVKIASFSFESYNLLSWYFVTQFVNESVKFSFWSIKNSCEVLNKLKSKYCIKTCILYVGKI